MGGPISSGIDMNKLLENAIPVFRVKRDKHVAAAKTAREELDRSLQAITAGGEGNAAYRERQRAAGEVAISRHEQQAKVWSDRIVTAENEQLLLWTDDPDFQSEFRDLIAAGWKASRVKMAS